MHIDADQVLWSVPAEQRLNRPLLILLHGHGMDETIGFDRLHHLPPQLVVASLRGPLPVRAGYGWFPLDASFSLSTVSSAVAAVLAWIDEQRGHPSIGLLGFSQGSVIAAQCLRERPDQFAYAALLAGFVSPIPAPGDPRLARRRPPVFSGRGDADHLLPPALVSTTEYWLQAHTTLTSRTYAGLGHNVSQAEIADLARFLTGVLETT